MTPQDVLDYNEYYYPPERIKSIVQMYEWLDATYNVRTYVTSEILEILPKEIVKNLFHLPHPN